MLSLRDCLDLADVSEAELIAISRHEHIPAIVAVELGEKLIKSAGGRAQLRQIILDDIAGAQQHGRCKDCELFSRALRDFIERHPDRRQPPSGRDESLRELLAIAEACEVQQAAKGSKGERAGALRRLQEAKDRHDCCACRRLSLGLVRLLDASGVLETRGFGGPPEVPRADNRPRKI